MRALLVGKNMVGMQTGDVLRAFDYLLSRPDVAADRITVIGKGHGGVSALYAAAVEPRIAPWRSHARSSVFGPISAPSRP